MHLLRLCSEGGSPPSRFDFRHLLIVVDRCCRCPCHIDTLWTAGDPSSRVLYLVLSIQRPAENDECLFVCHLYHSDGQLYMPALQSSLLCKSWSGASEITSRKNEWGDEWTRPHGSAAWSLNRWTQVTSIDGVNLKRVTLELNTSHQTGSCIDTDVLVWMDQLRGLIDALRTPPAISTRMDYENTSCINKPLVIEAAIDIFDESIGNITIGSQGQQITHRLFPSFAAARGRKEYASGCDLVNFKVKQLFGGKENLFGIMPATSAIHSNPSFAPSVYGWTAGNSVFLNGTKRERCEGRRHYWTEH